MVLKPLGCHAFGPACSGHGGDGGFGKLGGWAGQTMYYGFGARRMATAKPVDAFPLQMSPRRFFVPPIAALPVVSVKPTLGNAAKVEAGRRHVLGQEALEAGPRICSSNDTQLGFHQACSSNAPSYGLNRWLRRRRATLGLMPPVCIWLLQR